MRQIRRPDRGFTLVELMVTVSILMLLAGILTPSVIAIMRMWERKNTEWQLASIKEGIWTYAADNRVGATYFPSNWTLEKRYQTGAEMLAYFLLGPEGRGLEVERYGIPNICGPYYPAAPDEVREVYASTSEIGSTGPNWLNLPSVGTDYEGRVFVDRYSTTYTEHQAEKTRPILFFAAGTPAESGNPFLIEDNDQIIKNKAGGFEWASAEYNRNPAVTFDKYLRRNDTLGEYVDGFVLMSAGADRQYFTEDDILDHAEKLSH
jgi:prepilin-type N-terminal cleavage/methylation domain-containing protein